MQNQTLQWAIYKVLCQCNTYKGFWEEVLIKNLKINIQLFFKMVKISKA